MAREYRKNSKILLFIETLTLCSILGGCGTLGGHLPAIASPPVKIVVGPVILEAPITTSTQIHSFEEDPSPEMDPVLLAQFKEEIQIQAQRFLTEHFARQSGFVVVSFDEARRILAGLAPPGTLLTDEQVRTLGYQTGADIVVTGLIHDYGAVRWQYWVSGLAVHASAELLIVGLVTAWNPIALGSWAAFDLTTDIPLWYGGAYVFGWSFRPVRVHLDAVQLKSCEGPIWTDDALRVKVPGKDLAEYSPEQQKRKEVQLEANLNRAMADIAEAAGEKLAIQACAEDGKPEEIGGFSFSSIFDFLL